MTVSDIISAIGHSAFAQKLGVADSAVSNMKRANKIPAKKYQLTRMACMEAGLGEPNTDLFSFDAVAE